MTKKFSSNPKKSMKYFDENGVRKIKANKNSHLKSQKSLKNKDSEIFNDKFLSAEFWERDYFAQKIIALEKKQKRKQLRAEKIQKRYEKRKFTRKLEDDKLSKNIIFVRKNAVKHNNSIEKTNSRRVKRCNKYLISGEAEYRDIYFTIDKFNSNGKKTIVYFNDNYFPVIDGVVTVIDNYAKLLRDKYNIVVCVPKHRQVRYKTDKYLVLSCDSIFIKSQGYDMAFPQVDPVFQKYISLLNVDIVHVHSPFAMGAFGVALAKRRKVPCFATMHSQYRRNFYNAVKNELITSWLTSMIAGVYKRATVAVTMNDFTRKLMHSYGIKKNIEIIPNATDLKRTDFKPEFEEEILKKHKINKDEFNIIFIGRFVEVKNVYFILEVLKKLVKINNNFKYIFLGYGPEQGKMIKYVKENGLIDNVLFTGKIDSVEEKSIIIKNSTLMFFPSDYDTDGIVRIECACYGVPTLCIEDTGVSANIINNHNGFTEKYSIDAFVKRLDELIKNVDFVKEVGKNAINEIYVTWEMVGNMLDELYQKYLKSYYLQNAKQNKDKTTKKVKAKIKTSSKSKKKSISY